MLWLVLWGKMMLISCSTLHRPKTYRKDDAILVLQAHKSSYWTYSLLPNGHLHHLSETFPALSSPSISSASIHSSTLTAQPGTQWTSSLLEQRPTQFVFLSRQLLSATTISSFSPPHRRATPSPVIHHGSPTIFHHHLSPHQTTSRLLLYLCRYHNEI